MNKRGAWEDLKKIILALIFGIILIIFMLYFSGVLTESGDKAACKNWVNMQASLKVAGVKLVDLKSPCVTFEEEIKISKKDEIYEQLAKSMYDCWDMYGAGRKDFYGDWFNTNTHCMICSEISIDEKVAKKRPSIDIDDFEIYLSNNNPPNHGETYAEYFLGTKNTYIDFGEGGIPLSKEESLYTIFVITKGDAPSVMENVKRGAILSTVFTVGGGILGGVTFGTVGTLIAPVAGTSVGVATGFKIGLIAGNAVGTVVYLGKKSYVYPGLLLATGKESFEKGCEDYYYNPQKKLFDGFKEGLSGGGGGKYG